MLSVLNNEFMLASTNDTASVGDVDESITITFVPEECHKSITGPELDLDYTFSTSVVGLAHDAFLYGT